MNFMRYMHPVSGYIFEHEELELYIAQAFDDKDEEWGYKNGDEYEAFRKRMLDRLIKYTVYDALKYIGFKSVDELVRKVQEITNKNDEFCRKLCQICIWGIESIGDFEVNLQIQFGMTKEQTSQLVDIFVK